MSTLRIRNDGKAKVRELNIPKDIEELEKVIASPRTTDEIKKFMIKKLTKVSPCCICAGIPSLEVVYYADGASRIERYCEACLKKCYEGESVL